MTDRNTRNFRRFGPRFLLATLLAAFAAFASAEEPTPAQATDELEPAVDTSAELMPAVDASAPAAEAAESTEDRDRPVPLPADVTRQQTGGQVMDRLELGRTEITGNQELPKVLYIVPWRKSDPGDLMGRPVNTLLHEVLAPLDREEFIRQVEYHNDLYGE